MGRRCVLPQIRERSGVEGDGGHVYLIYISRKEATFLSVYVPEADYMHVPPMWRKEIRDACLSGFGDASCQHCLNIPFVLEALADKQFLVRKINKNSSVMGYSGSRTQPIALKP